MDTKRCPRCCLEKPHSEFYKNNKGRGSGLQPYCKLCSKAKQQEWRTNNAEGYRNQKKRQRLRRFSITSEQFDRMLSDQGGGCAVCGTDITSVSSHRLSVDHDHSCCPAKESCGKCIRGILCSNCNSGLGHFKDNPELLERASEYLRSHSSIVYDELAKPHQITPGVQIWRR